MNVREVQLFKLKILKILLKFAINTTSHIIYMVELY